MAKVNALFGKATGKVGALVFQVNSGTQIMKEKPAKVSNPQTDAQVEQRAKFKLLSQLAVAFDGYWGFVKSGLVSARNKFISANINAVEFIDGKARVALEDITLTGSSEGFPSIAATAGQGNTINVALESAAASHVDAVRYVVIKSDELDKAVVVASKLTSTAGADRTFAAQFDNITGEVEIYAYGLKYANESTKTRFENYLIVWEQDSAQLDTISSENLSGVSFTGTTVVNFGS